MKKRNLIMSTPEAEGIPSSAVFNFIQALEQHPDHPLNAVHGFMLLRHGKVAAEGWWKPYNPQSPHTLYSLSKSFTSSAIGLALDEGHLKLDDPVLKFFPHDAPTNPNENLKSMKVRHLLSMNTGHQEDTTQHVFQHLHLPNPLVKVSFPETILNRNASLEKDDNWARVFLSLPIENPPGTWFVYNTAASYMLSAIITKLTGESLLDYLRTRLFDPLGIENPTWEADPRGINLGGTGLHLKTEDIARFGQMYLDRGIWDDQPILSMKWVAEATKTTSDNSNTQTNPDWIVGYGYQFWRCRHNCYRGDGAFGQYCIIMPEQDAVLVMVSGVRDMQAVLDKVWETLLPAMKSEPLPADPKASKELQDKLSSLRLPLPAGVTTSPNAKRWSGVPYQLEQNELQLTHVMFEFGDIGSKLTLQDVGDKRVIQVGYNTWLEGTTSTRGEEEPIAACGAWTGENMYEVRICYYKSEFCPIFRFHFLGNKLRFELEPNVSWEDAMIITISGRMVGKKRRSGAQTGAQRKSF